MEFLTWAVGVFQHESYGPIAFSSQKEANEHSWSVESLRYVGTLQLDHIFDFFYKENNENQQVETKI